MAVSKAQQKAVTKYIKNTYDRFGLTMPKGHLDTIKAAAAAAGESVNAYINTAITQRMEQGTPSEASVSPSEPSQPPDSILTPSTPETAQRAAEFAGETVSAFLERAAEVQAERDRVADKIAKRSRKGGAKDGN